MVVGAGTGNGGSSRPGEVIGAGNCGRPGKVVMKKKTNTFFCLTIPMTIKTAGQERWQELVMMAVLQRWQELVMVAGQERW